MDDIAQQIPGPRRNETRGGAGKMAFWLVPGSVAAVAGVLMVGLAAMVRVPGMGNAPPTKSGEVPGLTITRLDWLPPGGQVRESLRLLDPTPLFMPPRGTAYSAADSAGMAERPGREVTATFDPAMAFPTLGPSRRILRPTPPQTPLGAADFATGSRWFDGLARSDAPENHGTSGPLALRATGRIDVYRRGEAARLASVEVPADPTLDAAGWQPVELDVLVNAAGAAFAPTVTVGSGVGEVDERLRVLTVQEILPRLRLRPGAYRLVVGP